MKHNLIVKIGNILFKWCFPFYKPLYFFYKKCKDRDIIKFLREKIKPGMTAIDIGSNIGFYTVLLSILVGKSGRVYAFEPDKPNFKYLKANTKKLKNVCLNNYAVGAKTGKINLYHSKELNTRHQTFDSHENRKAEPVDCITIDSYFKNGEKANFIKVDIEGYDYYAFLGMQEMVKRSDHLIILGEFLPYGLKKSGVDPEDYFARLKNEGFNINFFGADGANYRSKVNDKSFSASFYCARGS